VAVGVLVLDAASAAAGPASPESAKNAEENVSRRKKERRCIAVAGLVETACREARHGV
jgi:hypothetical protein